MAMRRCPGCMNLTEEAVCPHCGYSAQQNNAPNQLPVGTLLQGQYQVGRVLGQGGFGITYIGWDTYLDMVVAIKEFYPSAAVNRDVTQSYSVRVNTQDGTQHYEASRERFLREAKTLAKLQNVPEIVRIQNFFTENNTAYIIMEYVRGTDLRNYVLQRGGKVSSGELLPIVEPVIRALDTIHRAGLVHRDISPDNIMIQPSGRTKLLDFGAARDVENADADVDLAHSTEAILKHGFAPMEQYRSRGNLGPWTDEYGFCASLYYCLTGKVPPDAPARAMDDAQPDWDSITDLTDHQRAALEKGMAMRAKDRFGSMEELRKALYEQVPIQPFPNENPRESDTSAGSTEKKGSKKPAVFAAVLLALLLANLSAVWYFGVDTYRKAFTTGWSMLMQAIPREEQPAEETSAPAATEVLYVETLSPETEAETQPVITEHVESVEVSSEPWVANVMRKNPLRTLNLKSLASVDTVTFLDTLADMPTNAVDVSADSSGRVMGWTKWSNGYHVYFAAEGGINGRDSCEGLFRGCPNLKTISFGDAFHTDYAVNMTAMFAQCCRLRSVDLDSLNTGNVQNMQYMFSIRNPGSSGFHSSTWVNEDFSVTEMDLSSWDVGNVTDMSYMFYGRHNLSYLDVSSWDVSSLQNMDSMFQNCSNLKTLDVRNWEVSSLTNLNEAFSQCNKLTPLDVSRWDVSNVTNMAHAFYYCNSLQTLSVANWDVSNVRNMSNMFAYCSNLQSMDVSQWDVSGVSNMSYMFYACSRLKEQNFDNWDVSNVTNYKCFMDNGSLINQKYWTFFFEG